MQMEFVLKNTHTKGAEIKEFLEEKTSKLKKFFNGPFHARWNIVWDADEHEAHLHVTASHFDHTGKARNPNIMSAIEEAVEKLEKQLSKHKEIVQDHHNTPVRKMDLNGGPVEGVEEFDEE
jgi:putative sigma-54 modulation protein